MSSTTSASKTTPQSPTRVTRSSQISTGSPPPPRRQNGRKGRADPSITPRKFRKFFTPRSHGSQQTSAARQALFDITTAPAHNRNVIQSSPLRPSTSIGGQENSPTAFTRDLKRRKLIHDQEESPEHKYSTRNKRAIGKVDENEDHFEALQSSPCLRSSSTKLSFDEEEDEDEEMVCVAPPKPIKRITSMADRGLAGRLYQMSLGGTTRGARQRFEYPVNDWRDETAAFSSASLDTHTCTTNTLTAVGDEEGRVRLLESGKSGEFKDPYLTFRVHTNAIIDMSFSEDDSLLATASGDSTARVVDMNTQTTIAVLGNHYASLKQVQFQPGVNNHSVLATSSRDGCVQIWDLRCKGYEGPVNHIQLPVSPHRTTSRAAARKLLYGRPVNSINDAHKFGHDESVTSVTSASSSDIPSRGESVRRIGDISVTAITFLPAGQEHLLLTACEADASVKLWDIRALQGRRKVPIALSQTQQPLPHNNWRHFGVTSMNVGSGGRLYTLCKDNTVYTYSIPHLILGHAPELSQGNEVRRVTQRPTQKGLEPLYGFRHQNLHTNSFYVKTSIRKAQNGKSEMLAVGSSNGCAILFPTDERYFPKPQTYEQEDDWCGSSLPPQRPTLRRVSSGLTNRGNLDDSCPISYNGTALSHGHHREVGSVTWNSDGELITISDDYLVRVWREGDEAKKLRAGDVEQGIHEGNGWAKVGADYDQDDDE
ncbi:hypothetical protein G7Y89_g4764 [Cudoniella acicularis]|uniref:Uncharacterized protein n=1 Tax=Cudoniella acicularis TaxID=354080 RepID=A0A8H4W3Z8_9HELO|nr:hypothetical protein G7Y89_g4764 [Cudoniella acicularis]